MCEEGKELGDRVWMLPKDWKIWYAQFPKTQQYINMYLKLISHFESMS